MKYTEQDVEKVAEAMEEASWSGAVKARMQGGNIAIAIEWADLARVALEAMAREPLENVLGGDLAVSHVSKDSGYLGWFAKVEDAIGVRYHGHGATIDEAIRAAVAAANEGR